MENLFISELLLLSQKEKKAKKIKFDERRTLIFGGNETGKSSLIKSIYYTFGCDPFINPQFIGANVLSFVKFQIKERKLSILRDGRRFGIFDSDGKLIKFFDSVTDQLGPYLSDIFDFKPLFQSKNGEFITPPPAFLFLPYYIDQDTSWTRTWDSFKKLQQIKDYRNQCIYYHSGIRPNEYYQTRKEIEKYTKVIEEVDNERKLTKKILLDIRSKLSQTNFNIDIEAFKDEIRELLVEMELLKKKEEKLKITLLDLYNIKSVIEAQIDIVKHAIIENNKDLEFATKNLPSHVDCPTCGAEYENSFIERFEIAHDEQKSKDLLIELNKELDIIIYKINIENESLTIVMSEVSKVQQILDERKGDVKLKDVIDSAGKNQVKALFEDKSRTLQTILLENALKKDKLVKQLKSIEKKEKKEVIISYYQNKMTEFLKKLDVSLKHSDYKAINTKIENKQTGSSKPRALIAYYFSFFNVMQKFSTSAFCPLIIDSPNQQDQDIKHIDLIMSFINDNQPPNSQLIIGMAETYGVNFDCKVIELKEKYHLLQESEYEEVKTELDGYIQQLWL